MPTNTANGGTTPVGSDPYALTADLKKAIESVRSIIPIASAEQLAALPGLFPGGVLPVPSYVQRQDLYSEPVFRWDGVGWKQITGTQYAEFTFSGINQTGGNGAVFDPLVLDTARSKNHEFCHVNANGDAVVIDDGGAFVIASQINPSAEMGNYHVWAVRGGETIMTRSSDSSYGNSSASHSGLVFAEENDQLVFGGTASNTVTFAGKVKIFRQVGGGV